MYWWTSLERDRRRHRDPPIEYWNDLRGALRHLHIPSYYNRELMDKLQRLQQKNMSVEDYRQKVELYMMRASTRKEETTTIARFLSGLSLEIRDKVELLPYQDLNDLIQLCIKLEEQNLRKESSRKESSYSNSYPKKEYIREREDSLLKDKSKETPKNVVKDVSTSQPRSRDIQCFKCLGRGKKMSLVGKKRKKIVRRHTLVRDEYNSQEDESSGEEEKEDSEEAYPCEGELMMIKGTLNNHPSVNHETQRENIFHTRCKVSENICSLNVDSGSCCNCCSTMMVEKLNLQLIHHPKPYKL